MCNLIYMVMVERAGAMTLQQNIFTIYMVFVYAYSFSEIYQKLYRLNLSLLLKLSFI